MVCVPRWQQSAFSRPNSSIGAHRVLRHCFSGDSQSILRGPYFVPFKCGVLATAWICWHCHRQTLPAIITTLHSGVNSVWATVFGRLLSIACGNIVPFKVREPAFAGFLSICSRASSFDPQIKFSSPSDRIPAPFESVSSYFGSS